MDLCESSLLSCLPQPLEKLPVALAMGRILQGGSDYCEPALNIPNWDILLSMIADDLFRSFYRPKGFLQGIVISVGFMAGLVALWVFVGPKAPSLVRSPLVLVPVALLGPLFIFAGVFSLIGLANWLSRPWGEHAEPWILLLSSLAGLLVIELLPGKPDFDSRDFWPAFAAALRIIPVFGILAAVGSLYELRKAKSKTNGQSQH